MLTGDVEAAASIFDPEVEIYMADEPGTVSLLDLRKVYRGVEGFGEFLGRMAEAWGDFRWVPEDFIDGGEDVVVVYLRLKAAGRASGVEVDRPMTHLCTMRGGKLVKHETFWNREAALESVGSGTSSQRHP